MCLVWQVLVLLSCRVTLLHTTCNTVLGGPGSPTTLGVLGTIWCYCGCSSCHGCRLLVEGAAVCPVPDEHSAVVSVPNKLGFQLLLLLLLPCMHALCWCRAGCCSNRSPTLHVQLTRRACTIATHCAHCGDGCMERVCMHPWVTQAIDRLAASNSATPADER